MYRVREIESGDDLRCIDDLISRRYNFRDARPDQFQYGTGLESGAGNGDGDPLAVAPLVLNHIRNAERQRLREELNRCVIRAGPADDEYVVIASLRRWNQRAGIGRKHFQRSEVIGEAVGDITVTNIQFIRGQIIGSVELDAQRFIWTDR